MTKKILALVILLLLLKITSAQTVTHYPITPFPKHGSDVVTAYWPNGEPMIIKDCTPGSLGELFGVQWSSSTNTCYLFKSADQGATWSFINPSAPIGWPNPSIVQDKTGKCHLYVFDYYASDSRYQRIALQHDANGAITGFAKEGSQISMPLAANTLRDVRYTAKAVLDGAGVETLVFLVNDNPNESIRIRAIKAPINATQASDFTDLSGTPGASTQILLDNTGNTHDHNSLFAQSGGSADIWVAVGPVIAEPFPTPPHTLRTIKLTATGHTWSVGTPMVIADKNNRQCPLLLCMSQTNSSVWIIYTHPDDGVSFDKISANGTYTHAAIPSPDPRASLVAIGAASVSADDSRAYLVYSIAEYYTFPAVANPWGQNNFVEAFWNGSKWTGFTDPGSSNKVLCFDKSWGLGGSIAWDNGIACLVTDEDRVGYSATIFSSETYTAVPVSGVTLSSVTAAITVNSTNQLTATVLPANATNKSVTWSSDNTAVATVSNTGLVKGVSPGSAVITVTTVDGGKKATCNVTVNNISVTNVSLNISSASLLIGGEQQLSATVLPANAANKSVTWSSDNTAVATVSNTGLVKGVSSGSAVITVNTVDGGKKANCSITVNKIKVTGVSVDPSNASITVLDTKQLTAYLLPANASDKKVSWSSNNTAVATVSATGLVTAIAPGTATITVKTDSESKTATSTIVVNNVISGINDVAAGASQYPETLHINPNPISSASMSINISNLTKGDLNIVIFDVKGKVVFQNKLKVNEGNTYIKLKNLKKGLYLLKAVNHDKIGIQKLIIE